mmetsp:Transcript_8463/g.11656  ORF Transcript_8463/g.11656 Transcript_8463/m.11656 type:complete len:84 (-) Transcript_8463:1140-1391(-)
MKRADYISLICHIGGATMEATVVKSRCNYSQAQAKHGKYCFDILGSLHDLSLGGRDFDESLLDYFRTLLQGPIEEQHSLAKNS